MSDPQLPPAYILCGGRSERFGADKALVEIAGQPQLLRLTAALMRAGHSIEYVADRADRYQTLGIRCLVDTQPDSGPMGGLATALAHRAATIAGAAAAAGAEASSTAGWLWLINCDQTQWQTSWSDELFTAMNCGVPATPESPILARAYHDSSWQPLPALYHCQLFGRVEQRLRTRQLSLNGLLGDLELAGQAVRVQREWSPRQWSFNTRGELADLL